MIMVAFLINVHFQPFGKGVDDRKPDAVQTAGNFISAAAEFTAGVQFGQNDFHRRNFFGVVDIGRDAAPVIRNGAGSVFVDGHGNGVAIAGKGFVDRVVYDFVNQVVQSAGVRRTDVHSGAFSDRIQPFENLDLFLAVDALNLFFVHTATLLKNMF